MAEWFIVYIRLRFPNIGTVVSHWSSSVIVKSDKRDSEDVYIRYGRNDHPRPGMYRKVVREQRL